MPALPDDDLAEDQRVVEIRIAPEQAGLRLDRALADAAAAAGLDISRSRMTQLIADGRVAGEGAALAPAQKVSAGALYRLFLPSEPDALPQPDPIPLSIIFEDADLIRSEER